MPAVLPRTAAERSPTDQKQQTTNPACVCVSSARSRYILRTARWSHRPCCMRTYSRRTNHLTSHTCTCGHAMSASAAGVSSACFQQEEWSGVGFGPVVFRIHNANLSPYLRSFPRQRIFQGSGKSNWKCIRLPICFFPGREKAKWFRLPICF